ncbi:MAG TPA: hypothetical protein VE869_07190 [Gemmatimonas sp.]|nr:hypothetical protein [Gemmatimonas sp.]
MTARLSRASTFAVGTLALALAGSSAHAQQAPAAPRAAASAARMPMMASVDSNLFRGIQYRLVGHSRGGRATTVTGVPSEPRTFYMGVASGGVFRTTNGGESWTPITDGKMPIGSIGSIAVADADPKTIYVGTGSDGVRSNVSTGRGVYKTTDAGATWQFAGLYDAGQIGALRIHPTNSNTVWVAAYGDIFKKNTERGVFKTTDGGRTWKKTLYVSDSSGAMDVEVMPGNPSTLFAWISRIERKPWSIISGSREGGFYKSTDGGETWTKGGAGLPSDLIGKGNIAVTAANPQRLYLLVEALPGGGLYRSDNAGTSWQLVNSTPGLITRPFYYTTLGADPTNADVVYGGAESFYKSTDGGKTVAVMRTPHGDNHDIWINPTNGQTMVQANDGGANVSFDGGRTWSTQENQPTAEFYGVWADNKFPYNLYSAQQDNSTWVMSSISDPSTSILRTGPGCETGPIIPHPTQSNIIYGSCKGQYQVMNTDIGTSKNYWIGGQSLYGNDGGDLIFRMQRVSPMALSPHDPNILYYGSQYLHRTRDKGITWEKMSPDLTAFPKCCQGGSGEPITRDVTGEEFFSTLYAITESPLEQGVIWTGANDGPFHVTRDNGKTWTNITPKDLEWGGRVAWIEASPHRRGSAYFAVYRYLLGDYAPYIYRTDDYGKSWKRLTDGTNGIPKDWPTRVVREDPSREGLLYAGTEFGMFISFDNGAHWQSFQLNLPNVPINEIRVHKKDLIVATQGRANWIIDNLSSLHQIGQQSASNIHLYKPRDGYRTSTGAAFLGPHIEYYLPSASTDTIKLEILDAAGKIVNTYKSGAAAAPAGGRGGRGGGDPDDPDAAMMDGRAPRAAAAPPMNVVTTKAGLNRFAWGVQDAAGMGAAPGRYQARLTVAGRAQTVPFNVLIDPRLAAEGVTSADLAEQHAHNTKVRALVADVGSAVTRVRAGTTRLKGATGAAADTLKRVEAIAEKLNTQPIRYGKPGLQAHVSYLAGMTSRGDQKVGKDALARYATLKKEFDAIAVELNRILPQRVNQ